MKKLSIYPGFTDVLAIFILVYFLSGMDKWTVFFYISVVAAFRIALYVVTPGHDLRISHKRLLIKLVLFVLPIPYVLLQLPLFDWRTVVAVYISATTLYEFVFTALKFYFTRRFR